jgi:hypothetical protein
MAIDINIPSQVAQTITNGVTGTAPSQDAVFDALALKENAINKGLANGYAPLNASTKIDSTYLPSYVDDVIEVANYAALPVTGETGKIYITLDTNLIYRWSGTVYIQVGAGGVGGATWGTITGDLINQTDLQSALDAKVPYTGATTNVNLGEWQLSAGQVTFDQSPTGTAGVGVMRWNDTDGTVNLGLKGGQSTLKIGQETVARVVNGAGANLLASQYKVVKVTSAQGQRLQVNLAQANNDNNSVDTIGIVSENINNNQEGYIKILGQIEEINTTGSLQTETWADGDVLYLSTTVAGAITNIKPIATSGHIVVLGYVEYAHAIHGKIFVKIMNGWEIDELHNVYINPATQANNDLLVYNSTSQLWENKTVVSALGYTPANQTITISTTSPLSGGGDLSANRTLSIANAAADGTTKGAATFTASDFDSTSGLISIDYTNGQAASTTNKGFLTATDWNTFNAKADINPRVQTVTSAATVTPTSLNDLVVITAQAAGLTIANPTGTMVQGQALMIRIKDNGTARTIGFGNNYRAIGITLPTTTVISKTLYLGCIWNSTDTKFDVVGLNQEA